MTNAIGRTLTLADRRRIEVLAYSIVLGLVFYAGARPLVYFHVGRKDLSAQRLRRDYELRRGKIFKYYVRRD